jgi:VIT1/CCC1 family predicted Fe2+/Mn2+ transporter
MATRDVEEARKAYELGDINASKKAHGTKAKEGHKSGGGHLKSFVYGGLDGIITSFAVVSGVVGVNLSAVVVLILGISNLVADGISMSIGDYLSTKSEIEFQKEERKREEWEVENNPEGEMQEMEEIYINKGLTEADAKLMCETLSKNSKAWVDIMMVEELGIIVTDESPIKNALVTFGSFIACGICPLLPYIIGAIAKTDVGLFYAAIAVTATVLFLLGVAKTRVTGANPLLSGMETMIMGCAAAGIAYLISFALEPLAADDMSANCPAASPTP